MYAAEEISKGRQDRHHPKGAEVNIGFSHVSDRDGDPLVCALKSEASIPICFYKIINCSFSRKEYARRERAGDRIPPDRPPLIRHHARHVIDDRSKEVDVGQSFDQPVHTIRERGRVHVGRQLAKLAELAR